MTLKSLYIYFFFVLPTLINALRSGIKFDKTHHIVGKIRIIRPSFLMRVLKNYSSGEISIGKRFKCNNTIISNSIGLIQPCVFNISTKGSKIIIGDNVGISGSTINATTTITIGNNVLIGSGCLISDTDSHPIDWLDRLDNINENTRKAPITIEENVFLGARSIILKGVTIGKCSVIAAGSVVSKSVPEFSLVGGNPAKIIKSLNSND